MLFMFLFIGSSWATNDAESKSTISISVKNTKIEEVIKLIQNKTDFEFIYNFDDISKQSAVDVDYTNEEFTKVIEGVLKNTNLCYEISNKIVIIRKTTPADQQKKTRIQGVVVDKKGVVLPGVTVIVKGTTIGVSTDINGKFKIDVPKDQKELVFTFVGMEPQIYKLTGETDFKVVMTESTSQLNEIVVVNDGYQNLDKRKLSSSVVTVSGEKLKEGAGVTIDNMLQGKIAGLQVLNQTSTVGAAPKIRIRGASSISGNREPVWVVDGVIIEDPVPISAEELNSLDNVNLIGNAIASINPEDIANISVLKDASATAIYGVKAANGVIVITTKQGKIGKPRVKYSTNLTVDMRPQYDNLNRMNSKERIEVSKEIEERGLTYGIEPAHVAYEGLLYELYAGNVSYNEFLDKVYRLETVNTDWYDLLFRTAVSHKHNLTVSGADKNTNYYFSGSFNDTKGTFIDNNLKQYNGLLKINTRLNDKVKIGFQLRGYDSSKEYQHSSIDPYSYAYNTSRAIEAYDTEGKRSFYNREQGYETLLKYNILNELDNSERTIDINSLTMNGYVDYDIRKDLKFKALVSYSTSSTYEKEWFNDKTFFAAKKRQVNLGEEFPTANNFYEKKCLLPFGGGLKNNNTKNKTYTIRTTLNYKKDFLEDHSINTLGGLEVRSSSYEGISTYGWGYLPERGDKFAYIDPKVYLAYEDITLKGNPNVVTDRLTNVVSAFGTFTYAYKRKYIANFNIRVDGSNKFGQDKSTKYLPVWSTSARWNVGEENFIKGVDWINHLAVRASYGVQGNVSPEQGPDLITQMGSRDEVSGLYESSIVKLPNPKLTWEKTTSYDLAVDFSFLDGRVNGSFDVYKKVGTDQIVSKTVSATTGRRSMSLNAGDMENRGFDITLNVTPIRTRDFSWMLSVNGGKNVNEVTKTGITSHYTYQDYLTGRIVSPDKPLNGFYSYRFNGLNDTGHPTFKGMKQGENDTQETMYAKALVYSGKRVADISGGFSSSFKYKAFSLNLLFSYAFGKKIRLNDLFKDRGQQLPNPQQNMSKEFVKRWRKPGDEKFTNIPVLSTNSLKMTESKFMNTNAGQKIELANNGWQAYNDSDLRVVSGDFVRLRNVSLRYAVPKDFCKKLKINGANLKFEATNLFVIKDSKLKGQDPEQVSFSWTSGSGAIPPTSTFTFGLDVTF